MSVAPSLSLTLSPKRRGDANGAFSAPSDSVAQAAPIPSPLPFGGRVRERGGAALAAPVQ